MARSWMTALKDKVAGVRTESAEERTERLNLKALDEKDAAAAAAAKAAKLKAKEKPPMTFSPVETNKKKKTMLMGLED